MNQHDQMLREALRAIANMPEHDQDDAHRLRYMAQQALSHVNETPKNEHNSDDVLKRAPLVRLTDEQLEAENKLLLSMLKRAVFTLDGVIRSEYEGTNLYENYMSVCRDASDLIKQLMKEHPNG